MGVGLAFFMRCSPTFGPCPIRKRAQSTQRGEKEMFSIFTTILKVVSHLHTVQIAATWLVKGAKFLFHSNMGFLGLSSLMSHLGLN